jgi:outer membrane receptor protein involved in Fe transport
MLQGSRYVKAQTYLDLHAGRRFRVRRGERESAFSAELGVVNILDQKPPYDALSAFTGALPLYSAYGDPRRRRIELSLNTSF